MWKPGHFVGNLRVRVFGSCHCEQCAEETKKKNTAAAAAAAAARVCCFHASSTSICDANLYACMMCLDEIWLIPENGLFCAANMTDHQKHLWIDQWRKKEEMYSIH
jgi:hypothetical protein